MDADSPYFGIPKQQWKARTETLIAGHPLKSGDIVDVVKTAWASLFMTKIGPRGYQIGIDIKPKPQIIGFLLHELIGLELADRFPAQWRGEISSSEKDLVYLPDDTLSIELKTSSHPSKIFGNRSYAQLTTKGKKAKSGFYVTVNFDPVHSGIASPQLRGIRFGWVDSSDWVGQNSPTGQQAFLSAEIYETKLIKLYP